MLVKLVGIVKAGGNWRKPGEVVELPASEAQRLIALGAAAATGEAPAEPSADQEALLAELARLREFERQQLAAAQAAQALAEKEEAERKAAEEAAAKAKTKAGAKGEADGQTNGK